MCVCCVVVFMNMNMLCMCIDSKTVQKPRSNMQHNRNRTDAIRSSSSFIHWWDRETIKRKKEKKTCELESFGKTKTTHTLHGNSTLRANNRMNYINCKIRFFYCCIIAWWFEEWTWCVFLNGQDILQMGKTHEKLNSMVVELWLWWFTVMIYMFLVFSSTLYCFCRIAFPILRIKQ